MDIDKILENGPFGGDHQINLNDINSSHSWTRWEIKKWLNECIGAQDKYWLFDGSFRFKSGGRLYFKTEEDLIMFILRWG